MRWRAVIRRVVETQILDGNKLVQLLECGHIEAGGADSTGHIKQKRCCPPCSAERADDRRANLKTEREAEIARVVGHLRIEPGS